MRRWILPTLLGAILGLACGDGSFRCTDDTQCVFSGLQGQCQANQYCTFPDDDCPSGQRYGDDVGNGLAGMCLQSGDETTGGGSSAAEVSTGDGTPVTSSTSSSVEDSTSTSSSEPPGTTGPPPETTGPASTGTSTTGPPPEDPYVDCNGSDDCIAEGDICLEYGTDDVCAPPCREGSSCEAGGFEAQCVVVGGRGGRCVLPCSNNPDCPRGMQCSTASIMDLGLPICMWD